MKATTEQILFMQNMEKNFGIKYLDYGFYSDGCIGVKFIDKFGFGNVTVYPNGKTTKCPPSAT
jgi:hypothetical protein